MATKGSCKGKWNVRAKLPTWVINRRLLLDRDRIKGFILEHIRGVIQLYNVCGVKDESTWDLFCDTNFLDPVTTHHFSHLQLLGLHPRSRSSPFREWWAAFCLYIGQMFDKTCDQLNNWTGDNPRSFGKQVNRSNPQTINSGKVKNTCERFSWYGSDDLRASFRNCSR